MGNFHDDIEAEAAEVFYNTDDDISESVIYRPGGVSGNDREIQAVVEREFATPLGVTNTPSITLSVLNDSTLGISSDEIDDGVDLIRVSQRFGDAPEFRSILRVVRHDECEVFLEMQ